MTRNELIEETVEMLDSLFTGDIDITRTYGENHFILGFGGTRRPMDGLYSNLKELINENMPQSPILINLEDKYFINSFTDGLTSTASFRVFISKEVEDNVNLYIQDKGGYFNNYYKYLHLGAKLDIKKK